MPDKYYDVVVIGCSLGALAAAALLARRDFTVLLVGEGKRSCDYTFEQFTLRRRAFTMLAATSPAWRRVLNELAQTQTWNRRVRPVEPMLQALFVDQRFEVPPDNQLFRREVEREFPAVRRYVTALYHDFARVTAAADEAFEHDVVWPPGTFMERRETGRHSGRLPYARGEPHADLLAEFPRGHRYRRIVAETVRFSCDLALTPPAFAVARLHGAWTRGLQRLAGGEQELHDWMLRIIEANGGVVRLGERVTNIDTKRGAVCGVQLDGDDVPLGAGYVVTDHTGEALAAMTGGQGIRQRAQRDWPRVVAAHGRYVVSVVTRAEGVPEALGEEAFLFPRSEGEPLGTVHLNRVDAPNGHVLLVAETLRSLREPHAIHPLRGQVLRRLCQYFPYLERHLVVADSVHDGHPVWRYTPGDEPSPPQEVARRGPRGAANRVEAMVRQLEIDPPGYLGLAGEPLRGPVTRSLLVGPSVLPALGQEGQLLAACAAARVVTRTDKRKARMRREMWTKIEIS